MVAKTGAGWAADGAAIGVEGARLAMSPVIQALAGKGRTRAPRVGAVEAAAGCTSVATSDGSDGISEEGSDWATAILGAVTWRWRRLIWWHRLEPAQHRVFGAFAGDAFEGHIGDGTHRAPQPAIQRVAGDLFHRADMLAGDGAIDGADDRQMLQRIDHIQQVMKEAFVLVPGLVRARSR